MLVVIKSYVYFFSFDYGNQVNTQVSGLKRQINSTKTDENAKLPAITEQPSRQLHLKSRQLPNLKLGVDLFVAVMRVHRASKHGVEAGDGQSAVPTGVRFEQRLVQHTILRLNEDKYTV